MSEATFSPARFVASCRAALAEAEPHAAIVDIVSEVLARGLPIDDAFDNDAIGPTTLFASDDLTVQRIAWPPGVGAAPHDHRMWAVVGVYRGDEHNTFFERDGECLREIGRHVATEGTVLSLDDTAIHAVSNPSTETVCGLHVYGGAIDGVERSQWLPDGTEARLTDARPRYAAMWLGAATIADELGIEFTDQRRHQAYTAINAELHRLRRFLELDELEALLRSTWGRRGS